MCSYTRQLSKIIKLTDITIYGGRMAINSAQSADTFIVHCELCIVHWTKHCALD